MAQKSARNHNIHSRLTLQVTQPAAAQKDHTPDIFVRDPNLSTSIQGVSVKLTRLCNYSV